MLSPDPRTTANKLGAWIFAGVLLAEVLLAFVLMVLRT